MSRVVQFPLAVLFLVASVAPVFAEDSWVGQTVVLKSANVKIEQTAKQDEEMAVAALKYDSYQVIAETDKRINVRQDGVEGWFDKNQAVLASEAVDYFTARIQATPSDAGLYVGRAEAWKLKGEIDRAMKDLNEAIRLDPKFVKGFLNRGILWMKQDEYAKAVSDFDEAIRLDPKSAVAFANRGIALTGSMEYRKAILDYDKAVRLDPKSLVALFARGNFRASLSEDGRAIGDYDEIIRLDPKFAPAFLNRGLVFAMMKEYDKAIRDYDEAIRLAPTSEEGYRRKASLLAMCRQEKIRDGKKAVELATRACELSDWKSAFCLDTLAAAYAETGDFAKAIKWQTKALEDPKLLTGDGDEWRRKLQLYKDNNTSRHR
jgi:tetratricopeptide (TPR) repeat protein